MIIKLKSPHEKAVKRKKRLERLVEKYGRPHKWFAWHPVRTINHEIVWLQSVSRVVEYSWSVPYSNFYDYENYGGQWEDYEIVNWGKISYQLLPTQDN